MTIPTDVFVGEFTNGKDMEPTVRLGNLDADLQVAGLLRVIASRSGRKMLVRWTGSKVPHGVEVLGHKIVWTQHGMVTAKGGDGQNVMLGTYQRVVEWGGPNKDKLVIAIAESIKAP